MPELAEQIRTCSDDPSVADRIQRQYPSPDFDRVWAVRLFFIDIILVSGCLLGLHLSGIRHYGANSLNTQVCCRSC
jgi:hypothetical protein